MYAKISNVNKNYIKSKKKIKGYHRNNYNIIDINLDDICKNGVIFRFRHGDNVKEELTTITEFNISEDSYRYQTEYLLKFTSFHN